MKPAKSPDKTPAERDKLYSLAAAEYGQALGRLVTGYEVDSDKRRDLLQEIHIALWSSLANFNGDCSLRTWTYRVGHNVAINHVVKDKRYQGRNQVSLDELDTAAQQADSADSIDASIALGRLRAMIQTLKAPDRQVILLYLDDVDANTIAQITGMSAANVATKIHPIKHLLARQFHEERNHD